MDYQLSPHSLYTLTENLVFLIPLFSLLDTAISCFLPPKGSIILVFHCPHSFFKQFVIHTPLPAILIFASQWNALFSKSPFSYFSNHSSYIGINLSLTLSIFRFNPFLVTSLTKYQFLFHHSLINTVFLCSLNLLHH